MMTDAGRRSFGYPEPCAEGDASSSPSSHAAARRRLASYLVLALCTSVSTASIAREPSAADRTLAEALFREGKRLMDEQRFEQGCPKLEASHKLDPGGGTLLNLALCHELQGKPATAWVEYSEALSLATRDGRTDRVTFAQQHMAAIEPILPRIVISVPPSHPPDLEIRINGVALPPASYGVAVPIDPGPVHVEASAPRRTSWSSKVSIKPGSGIQQVEVPSLADRSARPTRPIAEVAVDRRVDGMDAAPYWLGAVGLAGLGVGTYFGLQAKARHDESDEECAQGCTPRGVDLNEEAKDAAMISTGGFAVGVTAIGLGALLWFVRDDQDKDSPERSMSKMVIDAGAVAGGGGALLVGGALP